MGVFTPVVLQKPCKPTDSPRRFPDEDAKLGQPQHNKQVRHCYFGTGLTSVVVGVGSPGTAGFVGTGGAPGLTSLSIRGGRGGYRRTHSWLCHRPL